MKENFFSSYFVSLIQKICTAMMPQNNNENFYTNMVEFHPCIINNNTRKLHSSAAAIFIYIYRMYTFEFIQKNNFFHQKNYFCRYYIYITLRAVRAHRVRVYLYLGREIFSTLPFCVCVCVCCQSPLFFLFYRHHFESFFYFSVVLHTILYMHILYSLCFLYKSLLPPPPPPHNFRPILSVS